jgi:hypothetical protein
MTCSYKLYKSVHVDSPIIKNKEFTMLIKDRHMGYSISFKNPTKAQVLFMEDGE